MYEKLIHELQASIQAAEYCEQRSADEVERAYWRGFAEGLMKAMKILEVETCSR